MTLTSPRVTLPDSDQRRYVIATNQQAVISTGVTNPHTEEQLQPVVLLVEIRDGDGVTLFLAWQSGQLRPQQASIVGFSWSSDKAEEYGIRTFAISDLQNPQILSEVRTSPIIVTDDEELLKNAEKITLFDNVPTPNFIWQDGGYTVKQIADQHEMLCGQKYSDFNSMLRSMRQDDEYLPYWFPQRVQFQYLQSNETFYRQPCTETYSDVIEYADYIMRGNDTVPWDALNSSDLFYLKTMEQALEYLAYFTYRGGNTDGTGIITTVGSYYSTKINCDITVDSSVRFIRVTEQDDNSMIIELNVSYDVGYDAGPVEYHKWKFEPNMPPFLMSSIKLGQCPAIE